MILEDFSNLNDSLRDEGPWQHPSLKVLSAAPQHPVTGSGGEEDTANVPKCGAPQGTHYAAKCPGHGFFLQAAFLGFATPTQDQDSQGCLTYQGEFCLGNNSFAKPKAFGLFTS